MPETLWDTLWPYAVVLVGAVATYMWRFFGVIAAGRLRPDSPAFELVGCIAYALLAGLVARLILLPLGPLQAVPLWVRLAATAIGTGVFLALGRNVMAGVAAGAGALMALSALAGP